MTEPSDTLRELAAQGRQIHAQYEMALDRKKTAPQRAEATVEIIDYFLNLKKRKRSASRVTKAMLSNSSSEEVRAQESEFDNWKTRVRENLGNITVIAKRMPPKPNSARQLQGFAASLDYSKRLTQLQHAVAFLEKLAERRLVWNSGLIALKEARARKRQARAKSRAGESIQAPSIATEGKEIIRLLASFPEEKEAIAGALSTYSSKGPDYGRQCLSSCRNALENLVRRIAGESEWTVGLKKIIPSETRRRTIRHAHSFLSAYGTHGSTPTSESDIQMGMSLSFVAIRGVIQAAFKDASGNDERP